jgi:GNAT superfamily N-acetyltransferase
MTVDISAIASSACFVVVAANAESPAAIVIASLEPPLTGLRHRRSLGPFGARFSAMLDGEVVGYIDVELRGDGDPRARQLGWSDIGNLWVKENLRRRGIGSWLLATAAEWLRLGGVNRLLTYAWPSDLAEIGFATTNGFRELARTERRWVRTPKECPSDPLAQRRPR